ncbi:MAG: thioredoxin [Alistipes sp.]|nr:thioredoxin [Alistipes sp.]
MKINRLFFMGLALIALSINLSACGGASRRGTHTISDSTKTKDKMTTIHLTKADFLAKVVNYEANPQAWNYLGDRPALVDFYADWCGPCKAVAPILEELAAEYGDQIYIYKVNTEEEPDLSAAFGIRSIPSLLFIPMNEKPQMMQGAMPKASLKEAIDTILLKK